MLPRQERPSGGRASAAGTPYSGREVSRTARRWIRCVRGPNRWIESHPLPTAIPMPTRKNGRKTSYGCLYLVVLFVGIVTVATAVATDHAGPWLTFVVLGLTFVALLALNNFDKLDT